MWATHPFSYRGSQIHLRPRGRGAFPEEPRSELPESSLPAALHQPVRRRPLRQGAGRQVAADQIQVFLLFLHTAQQSKCYSLPHLQPQLKSVPQGVHQQLIANLKPLVHQLNRKCSLKWDETWLFNISPRAALLIERWKRRRWCWELTDPGVLSLWASMCPNFWHTDECSMNGMSLFCYISTLCLSIASEVQWMVMRDDWKISQMILYISFSFCVILLLQPERHSFVVLYLYSDTSGFLIV